jgi:hypothetical protein
MTDLEDTNNMMEAVGDNINETLGEISERLDNLNDTLKVIADELYKVRIAMEK